MDKTGLDQDLLNPTIKISDIDKDGITDIAVAGTIGTNVLIRLYHWNSQTNRYDKLQEQQLPNDSSPQIEWMDVDNDGYPDLFVGTAGTSLFLMNPGTNSLNPTFTANSTGVGALFQGSFAVGDANNDGLPDVAMMALENSNDSNAPIRMLSQNAGLYQIDNNVAFLKTDGATTDSTSFMPYGSVAWADMDRDGRSDLIAVGNGNLEVFQSTADFKFISQYQQTGLSKGRRCRRRF